ncbi:MAG: AAA family ATPase [Phycisphaerae bacterium]|nr:AAA family ATPase [Phycisphaerae bacterium]
MELAFRQRRDAADTAPGRARVVVESVDNYCREQKITQEVLAKQTGLTASTLSQIFSDWREDKLLSPHGRAIPATAAKYVETLERWLDAAVDRQRRAQPSEHVPSKAVEKFLSFATRVQKLGTIGVITGSAGMGKTLAARVAMKQIAGTLYVQAGHYVRTPAALLREICASDPSLFRKTGGRDVWDKPRSSVERMRRAAEHLNGSRRLIIVDEAQKLLDAGMEFLREIRERWGVSILLVGTIDIHRRLRDDEDPQFGQIASRIGARLNLVHELVRSGGTRDGQWIGPKAIEDYAEKIYRLKLRAPVLKIATRMTNVEAGHFRRLESVLSMARLIIDKKQGVGVPGEVDDALWTKCMGWVAGHEHFAPEPAADDRPEQQAATA